jgi:microcystin-dependent protein
MTASPSGRGQAHENRQPFLALTYCIALQGEFPSR